MGRAFEKIRDGLLDAIAYTNGDTTRGVAHVFSAMDVRAIRKKTGLSQRQFSVVLHVPIGTLRNWEQGRRRPEGPARALLKIVDLEPGMAIRVLNS